MNAKRRPREEACAICQHYHDYEGGEPCGICGHVMLPHEKKQSENVIPTAIIPGELYLGSYDTASRSELLKQMGVTHILNTVPTCQALFKNTFTYYTVQDSPPSYEECFNFIGGALEKGDSKVLVHCMTGVSRSPAVIIAYLMRARKWRLAESYKWVKGKRQSIIINPVEVKRLMEFEVSLHGSCSVSGDLRELDNTCGFLPTGAAMTSPALSIKPSAPTPVGSSPVFAGVGGQTSQWSMAAASTSSVVFGSSPTQGSRVEEMLQQSQQPEHQAHPSAFQPQQQPEQQSQQVSGSGGGFAFGSVPMGMVFGGQGGSSVGMQNAVGGSGGGGAPPQVGEGNSEMEM